MRRRKRRRRRRRKKRGGLLKMPALDLSISTYFFFLRGLRICWYSNSYVMEKRWSKHFLPFDKIWYHTVSYNLSSLYYYILRIACLIPRQLLFIYFLSLEPRQETVWYDNTFSITSALLWEQPLRDCSILPCPWMPFSIMIIAQLSKKT